MTPDAATVIAYSAGLFTFISLFFLFSTRRAQDGTRIWYGLPFVFAALAGVMLVRPEALPGLWGLRLGAFFAMLAYGAGWQAARAINRRRPRPLLALAPCAAWLAFSGAFVHAQTGTLHIVSGTMLTLLAALFNGLAAREFWRGRDAQLPAATMLLRIFATYAGFALLRSLLQVWLPAPLGAAPTALWSVIVYNGAIVTEALLVGAFMIALLRERIAADHHRLAYQDPLTGAGNRRAFEARMRVHDGADRGLALIVFDIDRFKAINDRHGHGLGDRVIVRAAEVARALAKPNAVFRLGGEEFACLVEGVRDGEALALAERLRADFEREAGRIDAIAVGATISVGVALRRRSDEGMTALLQRADAALYEAKRAGRNRVAAADRPVIAERED